MPKPGNFDKIFFSFPEVFCLFLRPVRTLPVS